MGQKFVNTDQNGKVLEVFDAINSNVPADSDMITDAEFALLHAPDRLFSDYEVVGGKLQLLATAVTDSKVREIDQHLADQNMKAFIEVIIEELNTLRVAASLAPITLADFKTAMATKLA